VVLEVEGEMAGVIPAASRVAEVIAAVVDQAGIGDHENLIFQNKKIRGTSSWDRWGCVAEPIVFRELHTGPRHPDDYASSGLDGHLFLFRIPCGIGGFHRDLSCSIWTSLLQGLQNIRRSLNGFFPIIGAFLGDQCLFLNGVRGLCLGQGYHEIEACGV